MAEQTPDLVRKPDMVISTWSSLANGDTGLTIDYPQFADRNVQVLGTFGSGGTLIMQGSNDKTNWHTLTDMTGSPISFTSAGVKMIQENTLYVRPSVTAGDGTTDLTAIVVARAPR